jgi:hypothetical protein
MSLSLHPGYGLPRHCEPKAKQSRTTGRHLDCFVAFAPRNDGEKEQSEVKIKITGA